MLPLYDEERVSFSFPLITASLIFLNVFFFLWTLPDLNRAIEVYGFIPSDILSGKKMANVLTAVFLHGGFLHIIGNMWFLWLFGNNLEAKLGKLKFLIFYLLCGVLANLIYCFFAPLKNVFVIGASGAISGILGGYLVFFPKNKIKTIIPLGFFITTASLPAIIFLLIWFLYQFILPIPGIAHGVHIIGFLIGILLAFPLLKTKSS